MSIEKKKLIQTLSDLMENYPSYNKIYSFSTNNYLSTFMCQILNNRCPRNWGYSRQIKNSEILIGVKGLRRQRVNRYMSKHTVCEMMISAMKK